MPNQCETLVAGILAGGRSRRMGRPKALIRLPSGRTMIEHIAEVAEAVADQVVILGRADELPSELGPLRVLDDEIEHGGPLAGLVSLLDYAEEWTLLLACDLPDLGVEVISKLITMAGSDVDAVVFERGDRPGTYHACCGLYHARLQPQARDLLARRELSLQDLLRRARTRVLATTPQDDRQLRNVNLPADADWLGDP